MATTLDRDALRRRRAPAAIAAALIALALVETVVALSAPLRVPTDDDWRGAAVQVRAGFRPGDLIVAAPRWADPLMRRELGDLVPVSVAGRMDAERFGCIWEIAQRGARAPEAAGLAATSTTRHGGLTVTRYDRPAARVRFDFVAGWQRATLSRVDADNRTTWCSPLPDRHQCPEPGGSFVKPQILEIDTAPRFALGVQPVGGAALVLEYPKVALGRELAVAAGLHNVWLRKAGKGKVRLRVLVNHSELGSVEASNHSGWTGTTFDTRGLGEQVADVRFEITSDDPGSRYLGFAAEARDR